MTDSEAETEVITFVLDNLRINQNRLVAHGWCLHREQAMTAIELRGTDDIPILRAQFPLPRDDVAAVHANIPHARASGFFVLAWLPEDIEGAAFYGVDAAGNQHFLRRLDELIATPPSKHTGATTQRLLRRTYSHLRRGQLRRLWAETTEWATRRRGPAEPIDALTSQLRAIDAPLSLIIDHNMGGGANTAREQTIAELLGRGRVALLLTIDLSDLCYRWELRGAGDTHRFASDDLASLEQLLALPRLDEVILNNSVGFHDPLALNHSLVEAVDKGAIRLRFVLHDYFAICPSFALIGHRGRFCDLPDAAECAHCIQHNQAPFMHLVPRTAIPEWRRSWQAILTRSEQILAFSQASIDLLRRAYPGLSDSSIELRPHACKHIDLPRIDVDTAAPLHIGVLGHITYLKGAEVIAGLVAEIERRGLVIHLSVFGELDQTLSSPHLNVLGRYQHGALAGLIKRSGTNLFFFPAIWPETFSFVVQELMAMGLPVAAYRLGAPAERLAGYARGHLFDVTGAAATLDALIDLHRALPAPTRP